MKLLHKYCIYFWAHFLDVISNQIWWLSLKPKDAFNCDKICRLLNSHACVSHRRHRITSAQSDVATCDSWSARKTSKDRIYKIMTFHGPSKNESTLCAILQHVGNSMRFTQCNSVKSNQVRIYNISYIVCMYARACVYAWIYTHTCIHVSICINALLFCHYLTS